MNEVPFKLPNAPIVEAVVDIDCDVPPELDLQGLEAPARAALAGRYATFNKRLVHEHQIETQPGASTTMSVRHGLQALRFSQEDGKQLVQVRAQGFSFNRLAPYGSLDDYLPEIERTWDIYRQLASPVQIRVIRLRYINRIELPLTQGGVELADYFQLKPLPDIGGLAFNSFFNQHTAVEVETGHQVRVVLYAQGVAKDRQTIIFDNSVEALRTEVPDSWPRILEQIMALRGLKNRVFQGMLTQKCLDLFQ